MNSSLTFIAESASFIVWLVLVFTSVEFLAFNKFLVALCAKPIVTIRVAVHMPWIVRCKQSPIADLAVVMVPELALDLVLGRIEVLTGVDGCPRPIQTNEGVAWFPFGLNEFGTLDILKHRQDVSQIPVIAVNLDRLHNSSH